MARVHVDPAELRRFARDLGRFNGELQNLVTTMQARLRGLEASWRDQEHRKFAEQHERTMKMLTQFLEVSQEHVGFLLKKAGHAEEYLKQK